VQKVAGIWANTTYRKKSPEIKNLLLSRMSLVRVQLPEPEFIPPHFGAVFSLENYNVLYKMSEFYDFTVKN